MTIQKKHGLRDWEPSMLLKYFEGYIPHRWRNGERARLESGRSWVRALFGSYQRL